MKSKTMVKILKRLSWRSMYLLPQFIRREIIRSWVHFDLDESLKPQMRFEVATSKDDLEASFLLVQDSYLEVNISNNIDEIYRITKFHCLPTTRVFVAKYNNEVVATLTVILDSSFGLPIDQFSNVNHLRKTGRKVCEFSSLAIKREWRKRGNGIFIPFSIYVLKFCKENLGADYIAIATKASARYFYSDLYHFKPLEKKVRKAQYVNGKESFAQYMNLNKLEQIIKLSYKKKLGNKNLYRVWKNLPYKNICQFNEDHGRIVSKYIFTQEIFLDFFKNKNNILKQLSSLEKLTLMNYYKGLSHQLNLKDELMLEHIGVDRLSHRYFVNFQVFSEHDKSVSAGKTINISRRGLSVILYKEYQIGESVQLSVCQENHYSFKANICWKSGARYGLIINFESIENKRRWKEFLQSVETVSFNHVIQIRACEDLLA